MQIINYIHYQCENIGFFKNFDEEENKFGNNEHFNDSKIKGILIKKYFEFISKKIIKLFN